MTSILVLYLLSGFNNWILVLMMDILEFLVGTNEAPEGLVVPNEYRNIAVYNDESVPDSHHLATW